MTKLLREVLGPLPSFFYLEVKWIIRVNYHFNDLLFISKEDTENMFFLNAGRTNSRQFSCLKGHCCLFSLSCVPCVYFLASAWGQLCSQTAPLFSCCLTWPMAFGCWWILKVFCHRVVKGISDHFIMQIKLFYCNRNLTLLWQSERKRVGMIVFSDTE